MQPVIINAGNKAGKMVAPHSFIPVIAPVKAVCGNIIIPVNRCFDTIVDNHLVSEQTLHGIAFKQLYSSGRYTEQSLNAAIQRQLSNQPYQDIDIIDKPEGNIRRYPVGTIADIPSDETTHLFLWALSTFNRELKAQTSMQDYALAVQKLIEACNSESEG